MANYKTKKQLVPCALFGMALLPQVGFSLDGSMYLGGAAEYTSNSLQTTDNEQSDTSLIGLGGLDLTHTSGDFDMLASYSVEQSTFLDETQGDETTVNGQGEAHWRIRPDTLTWDFRHASARAKGLESGVDTAATRTTQKIYATGPRSILHLSPRDTLQLGAQLMQVATSGATDNKSDRELLDVALEHSTSQIQSIGLSASQQQVEFDEASSPDVKFSQVALNWSRDHRMGGMRLSAGTNRSEREGASTLNGKLLRAYIDFDNVGHVASLAAVNELTDSLLGLGNSSLAVTGSSSSSGFTPTPVNLDVVDVLESSRLEANYSTSRLCARCSPSLRFSWDDQDYQQQPLDQRVFTVTSVLGYTVTERLAANVTVSRSRIEFLEDQPRTDVALMASIGANYRARTNLELEGFVTQQDRQSENAEADYEESLVHLGIRYYFANF